MGQRKAYSILILSVGVFCILVVFLINAFAGFIILAAAIAGVCCLYKKQPWILEQFRKQKADDSVVDEQKQQEEGFKVHIVLVNNNALRPESIYVDSPIYVIGRQPECNYVIHNNSRVSREHAKIVYDELSKKSFIFDDNSKFGTRVNGEILEHGKRRQLYNGDIIQIEDTTFSVQTRNI